MAGLGELPGALALFCGDGYEEVRHATRAQLPPRVPAAPRDAPSVIPGAPNFTEVTEVTASKGSRSGPRCRPEVWFGRK